MSGAATARARAPRTLVRWEPEDRAFWEAEGRRIATQNLWISIPALLLAFAVWMIFSVVVVRMPEVGFAYSTNQLFWLTALPGLSGATLRIFYAFLVPIFGGRVFTTLTTLSLLVPALGIGWAVQDPGTSYGAMLALSLLCGLGGGNFASSMANISFFFPRERKGTALGLNAGLGNLGVSAVQLVAPLAITTALFGSLAGGPQRLGSGADVWLQNAALVWVPLIVASSLFAWFGMHDLASAKASFRDQAVIFRRKHNWVLCWLYTGTFGSFIGFSAGLPLLIKALFPEVNPIHYAFLGPLVGALARPVGGWLADRLGGARVTLWSFVTMGVATLCVLPTLPHGSSRGSFAGFLAVFLLLFLTSGIGNGSVFRMVPVMFHVLHERLASPQAPRDLAGIRREAGKESAAVIGFISAVAAYGAFFVPRSFGLSMKAVGSPILALFAFAVVYASCIAVTWWFYARRRAELPC